LPSTSSLVRVRARVGVRARARVRVRARARVRVRVRVRWSLPSTSSLPTGHRHVSMVTAAVT